MTTLPVHDISQYPRIQIPTKPSRAKGGLFIQAVSNNHAVLQWDGGGTGQRGEEQLGWTTASDLQHCMNVGVNVFGHPSVGDWMSWDASDKALKRINWHTGRVYSSAVLLDEGIEMLADVYNLLWPGNNYPVWNQEAYDAAFKTVH